MRGRDGGDGVDRRLLGGFKWSSQHLDGGGCDEGWETALGSGAPSRVAGVAWPTRRGAAGEPAAVLGGDCGGAGGGGRGGRGRRGAPRGGPPGPGGGGGAPPGPRAPSGGAPGGGAWVCCKGGGGGGVRARARGKG